MYFFFLKKLKLSNHNFISLLPYINYIIKLTFMHKEDLNNNRDIILPTKVHLVKAMVFPVVMCRCESWTVKKAER